MRLDQCIPVLALAILVTAGSAGAEYLAMDSLRSEDLSALNQTGASVTSYLLEARRKLAAGQPRAAVSDVARARQLLIEARGLSPAVNLRDKIADALGVVRKSPNPNALLPIYEQLDAYSDKEVVVDVRGQVDGAKAALAKGDAAGAETALYGAASEVDFLEIDLPIHNALADVDRALMLLHQKNAAQDADRALADALSQVEVVKTTVDRSIVVAD